MEPLGRSKLVDPHGRHIRKLRLSLLDLCNFRCFYCMPDNPKFMSAKKWLCADEIYSISKQLVEFGIEQIRLTGGEPTLRPELKEIVTRLSDLPIKKFGLTTNGFRLKELSGLFLSSGCHHINVSLDSLNRGVFNKITKTTYFDKTLAGVLHAKDIGLKVKINVVLMKGVNDQELFDFVEFSKTHQVEVRFLELMKIGMVCNSSNEYFMSAQEGIDKIRTKYFLNEKTSEYDSTSFGFKTSCGANIGFIASETMPFCNSCSRIRLTCDGQLRACLMNNQGYSIRHLETEPMLTVLKKVMGLKPTYRLEQTTTQMNELGG